MLNDRGLTKEGKWVYGWYVFDVEWGKHYIYNSTDFKRGAFYVLGSYEVIPESVGQQVGLKDKNGKEIYEGDIVRFTTNGKDFKTTTIEFQEHCYHAGFFPDKSTNAACWWEIVGNVHQPNLTEQDNG